MQAGNESNLILDPDLDSYYAMDALVNKAPLALATAGRVSSREIAMVASGHSTEAERIALAVDQGVLTGAVDAIATGFKTAYANTADATLRPTLDPALAQLSGATGSLTLELTRAVHRGPDGTAAAIFGKDAIASAAGAADAAGPRARPAARRPRRPPARQRPPGLRRGGLGIALAAYLFLAFFIAMTRSVARMVGTADAIAEGDLEQDLDVRSRDEIGALAQAFERMVAYLREAADAAGRIASGDLSVEHAPRSERDVFGTAFTSMAGQLRALVGAPVGLGRAARRRLAADGRRPPRRPAAPSRRSPPRWRAWRAGRASRSTPSSARARWPRRWPAPRAPRPIR